VSIERHALRRALGQVHSRHIATVDQEVGKRTAGQLVAALEHGRESGGIAGLGEDVVGEDQWRLHIALRLYRVQGPIHVVFVQAHRRLRVAGPHHHLVRRPTLGGWTLGVGRLQHGELILSLRCSDRVGGGGPLAFFAIQPGNAPVSSPWASS